MNDDEKVQWFVMRDLKRRNAKLPAYKQLADKGIKVFVPMKWHTIKRKGIVIREEIPVIQDLLFVYVRGEKRCVSKFGRSENI